MNRHAIVWLALNAVRVCNNYDNDRLFGTPASLKSKHHYLMNCKDTSYLDSRRLVHSKFKSLSFENKWILKSNQHYNAWFIYFYSFSSVYCIPIKLSKLFLFIWLDRVLITLSNCIVLIWFISHIGQKFNEFRKAVKSSSSAPISQWD